MKRAVPLGIGFVVLLALVALVNVGKNGEHRQPLRQKRVADFKSAMTEALQVNDSSEDEFNDLINTLPKLNMTGLRETFNTGVTTNETCHICFELFHAAKVVMRHMKQREMLKMGGLVCGSFLNDYIDPEICKGLLKQYFDTVYHIAEMVFAAGIDRNDACTILFGPSCGPTTSAAHLWDIHLPKRLMPKLKPQRQQQEARSTMNVVHLSDFHYDPLYREGAEADCNEPLCCRKMSSNVLGRNGGGDAKLRVETPDTSKRAGRFGDLRHCDMPMETLDSLVKDAANVVNKISHVYITGDIPPHDIWKSNSTEYFSITQSVYKLLARRMGPNVPVYPSIGNHEAVPSNLFATNGNEVTNGHLQKTTDLYNNLASFWEPWLDEEQLATVRLGGYYAKSVSPALKVISLNTNMCYYLNFYLLIDSRDPGGQLKWFVQELIQSEAKGQKVHVLGHIPPSSFDCFHAWSQQYLRIVQRFSSTITGQFFGHTHVDEFNLFYAEDRSTPIGVAFMAPSATSYSHVNPAYKMFTCDEDGVLRNAIARSADLALANAQGSIDWQMEYDTASTFGLDDLTARSMDYLAMKVNRDPSVFNAYYRFYHRNSPSPRWINKTDAGRLMIAAATLTDVHHNGPRNIIPPQEASHEDGPDSSDLTQDLSNP